MKKARLTIAALAVLLCSGATAVQAGPATSDVGGSDPGGALDRLPSFSGPKPSGGFAGSGPSFGGKNTQGAGFAADPPQGVRDTDEPNLLSTDSGAKNQ